MPTHKFIDAQVRTFRHNREHYQEITADMCTPSLSNRDRCAQAVARVPLPECDPVHGAGGPLFVHWT